MTLEDFFTLTEMNNGLVAPSRVRELMAVMEKERDCIVKITADATRHWSAVARALAATENKDCLDLFLQLDGLHFISKWLKDAQKFGDDKVDSFVEELITHLLQAVEKLDLDYEKLVASEIWTTVQNLFLHSSSKVQEKARAMFESWKSKTDIDKTEAVTVDEAGKSADTDRGIGHSETSPCNGSVSRETSADTKDHVLTKDDQVLSTTSDAIHPDQVESANNLDKIGDERSLFHVGSPSVQKPTIEPPPCLSVGTTSEPCSPAVPRQDTLEESSMYTMQSLKSESLSDKLRVLEEPKMSKGRSVNSCSGDFEEMKAATELSSHRNSTAGDKSSCDEVLSCIDSRTADSGGKGVKDEGCGSTQHRTSRAFIAKERGDFSRYMLPRSSSNEKSWGHKDLGASPSGIEGEGRTLTFNLHGSDNHRSNNYTFHKKLMNSGPDRAGSKKSDVEIDYGIVDPLEVARQVAMEVEREFVDYREPSCSSSEKLPETNTQLPNSPDSVSQSRSSEGSPMKVVNESDSPEESSPTQEESATSSEEGPDAEQADATQDIATLQVTDVAQEAADEEKGLCNLDLNQEVTLEDSDRPRNQFSAPVSIVSASRAAAVPALPSAPLQFEGNLGWKGSAVTSAFRPAGGSSSSSKQRQGFLDFDLNVAENVDPRTGESSAETSSRKSEHLALDLNHTSDDSGSILDWRIGQFLPPHPNHPLLSSKQPTRNIDLNDQPSYHNDSSATTYLSPTSRNFSVSNSDETVISIMGTRVEVNRKDFISQTPPLPNGRTPELAFDVNLRGAGNFLGIGSALTYPHPSMYGYNNIAPGPSMHFPSIYGSGGPIPYMVDSRGQHVIPQIVGSAPAAFSQPPFVLNMNTSTPSNGAGPSRSSLDLNSGMLMESGSKDPSGFGLFLNSAQIRSVDEQLRPQPHPQPTLTSVNGGKRKEPENGWENYPFKHYTPPWKQI